MAVSEIDDESKEYEKPLSSFYHNEFKANDH